MPVTKSRDELREENQKKEAEARRINRKRKQGDNQIEASNNHQNKRQNRKPDEFELKESECFEMSCWAKRHHHAWLREDGIDEDDK